MKADQLPSAGCNTLPATFDEAFHADRKLRGQELDENFRHLRGECARTLMLLGRLAAPPRYRFASADPGVDDGQAVSAASAPANPI